MKPALRSLGLIGLLVVLSGCEREAPAVQAPQIEIVALEPRISGTYEFRTGAPTDRDAHNSRWFYADLVAGKSGLQVLAWRPDRQAITVTQAVWTGTELLLDVERTIAIEGDEQPERWTLRARYSFGEPTFRGPCRITSPDRVLDEDFVASRVKVSREAAEEAYDEREAERAFKPPVVEGEEPVTEDPYFAKEHMGGRKPR